MNYTVLRNMCEIRLYMLDNIILECFV